MQCSNSAERWHEQAWLVAKQPVSNGPETWVHQSLRAIHLNAPLDSPISAYVHDQRGGGLPPRTLPESLPMLEKGF